MYQRGPPPLFQAPHVQDLIPQESINDFRSVIASLTRIKRTEIRLRQIEAHLVEAQRIGQVGSWNWSIETNKHDWSEEQYRIFGLRKGDDPITYERFLSSVHPDDRTRVSETLQRTRNALAAYDIDYRIVLPGGVVRFIHACGQAKAESANRPIHMCGTVQDVTDRELILRSAEDGRERAEEANEAKSEFLANMSHELRTPLNAIIGFAQLIQMEAFGPLGDARYLEYIRDIEQSGHHLQELIEQLLDLSKIEAGKTELDEENVDVHKIVCTCFVMVEGRAESGGVALINRCDGPDLPFLYADPRMVRQILINLLANAIRFTPPGGQITVLARADLNNGFIVEVSDTGIGIAVEDIPRALSRYEQVGAAKPREHEGTGLGLAICKSLVELHGGSFDLESKLGSGTVVTLRFPAERIVWRAKAKARELPVIKNLGTAKQLQLFDDQCM